ncbi:MAG: signal peptidase II [bacterium]|nr:signal peptidase II [bacterium]
MWINKAYRDKSLVLFLLLVFTDQISKQAAIHHAIPVLSWRNFNWAFSIPVPPGVIVGFQGCILLIMLIWLPRNPSNRQLFLLLIIAGGFSNLLDRLLSSGTIDIFQVSSLAFNFADIFIIAGAISLALSLFAVRNTPSVSP